jgi:hypothetical protein
LISPVTRATEYYSALAMSHSVKRRRLLSKPKALQLAPELNETGIKVNSADPSFTVTGLNSHRGTQSIPEGAAEAIRLAVLPTTDQLAPIPTARSRSLLKPGSSLVAALSRD